MSVNGKGASFEVGTIKTLFQMRPSHNPPGGSYPYDVSADGQRFLVLTAPDQVALAPITVVTNWMAGLKK